MTSIVAKPMYGETEINGLLDTLSRIRRERDEALRLAASFHHVAATKQTNISPYDFCSFESLRTGNGLLPSILPINTPQ